MGKRKIYLTILAILVLAILAANLAYPKYFNQGVDFLNKKFSWHLPHFWQIPFKLGLDLQGGTYLVYEADLSKVEKKEYGSAMQGLRDVIERRVNLFGVREPVVQTQEAAGHYRLIVELAGIEDPGQAIKEIGKTPFLEFREQKPEEEVKKIEEAKKEVTEKAKELRKKGLSEEEILEELKKLDNWLLSTEDIFKSTPLTGKYLKKAELGFDRTTYKPLILLQFDDEGAKIFEDLTSRNIGKPLAIYIDQILISAPVVQEKISGGRAQISGRFTIEEAKELARNLNAGALPVPINLISQKTIGPTLGKASLEKSLQAGVVGFLAIILFLILFYRLPGLLASLALGIYVILVLTLFKLIPVTLTLAGIGGFILSIGMAIDANILIFARMKEELMENKTFSVAMEEGFRRAWPSIRDGNLTTLIVAAILFEFGTSFIKGFALTLSLGILISIFSAIIITKNFLKVFVETRLEKIQWLWS
ncbi:MAG: protein translocase subunit SecD [Patescibacteria group bacterium]|nr:protein translocase subunit SecD [Patescibacteria group bacterium]